MKATREEMAAAITRARNATLKEPEWWRQTLGVSTSIAGPNVTPESALAVSAVYGCVLILAESIASLPMSVYRRLPNGGKEVATDHPVHALLHVAPNEEQTAFEAIEYRMASLALRGNAYGAKVLDGRGSVVEIQPLRPQHMRLDRDGRGKLVFDYQEPGAARVYAKDRIWYTRGFGTDGVTGLSPIGVHREAIGYAMTLNEHGARMYANGAQSSATIEIPTEWSDVAFDNFKKDFNENHAGRLNAGKPLILEGGAKYNPIGMNAVDAEYIASLKNAIAEIARMYRIPLHMLNELDKATFSNIEHQSLEFVTRTLLPWLKRLEDSANRDLFAPHERGRYFVKFNIDALLRGDIKSRYEAYQIAVTNGWMNRNEVRLMEDLNPKDGLDEYLVPLNMGGAQDEPAADDPPADPPADRMAAHAKAVRIERDRLDDEQFHDWAMDYCERKQGDGFGLSELRDLLTLGADGAIAKWSADNA